MIYGIIALSIVTAVLLFLVWYMLPFKEDAKLYKEQANILKQLNNTYGDRLDRLCDINDKALDINNEYHAILLTMVDKLSEIEIKLEREEDDIK